MRTSDRFLLARSVGLILAGLGFGLILSGCADNEAHEAPTAAPTELAGEPVSQAVEPSDGPAPVDPEPVDEREQAIARREREIDERMRGIDERVAAAEEREASLARRESELADRQFEQVVARRSEPKPEPAPRTFTYDLPASTELEIVFLDAVSSETAAVGDPLRGRVSRDVTRDGRVVIAAGSTVSGEVAGIKAQKKIGGKAWLSVGFTRLTLPSGESLPIEAVLESEGKGQTKKDAAIMGGSAAAGAVLGRVLAKDKTKGTLIGAVVGAAAGTAVASQNNGDPVVIEPDSVALVELGRPVTVTVSEAPERCPSRAGAEPDISASS